MPLEDYDESPSELHPEDMQHPEALRPHWTLCGHTVAHVAAQATRDVKSLVASYLAHPTQTSAKAVTDTIEVYLQWLDKHDHLGQANDCALWLYAARVILEYHLLGDETLETTLRRYSKANQGATT
jgi:hypothetical protein